MGITAILGLVAPIVSKLVETLFDRFWNHGVTTLQGTAGGAGIVALIQSWGCNLSTIEQTILASIPVAIGALSTDAGKTAPTIMEQLKSVVLAPKVVVSASDSQSTTK